MKLSIITINFNNKDGLIKTFRSVINQINKNYEWIVIDGGSTDGSKEIIEEYSSYISFWVSEPDKGIYNAMNKAIIHSNGEYCFFLNSGDFFSENDCVGKILPELTGEDYIFSNVSVFSDKKNKKFTTDVESALSKGVNYFYYDTLCHQGMFIKSRILKERPYNENLKIVADWEHVFERLVIKKGSYKTINLVTTYVLDGGVSARNNKLLMQERKSVAEMYYPLIVFDKKQIEYLLSRKDLEHLKKISSFACFAVLSKRYENKLYRQLFKPYVNIITKYGSLQLRFFNLLNIHRITFLNSFFRKVKGF